MDGAHTVKPIVYLGCPAAERAETEKALAAGSLSIVWADSVASAIGELQRRDMPVLLDLTSSPSVLRSAREIKNVRATTLMFAVVDARRPELTTEAVLGIQRTNLYRKMRELHVDRIKNDTSPIGS